MATVLSSSQLFIVVDASFAIAFCAREKGRFDKAEAYLKQHAQAGSTFFAPGVIVGEVLFVLCPKLSQGDLTQQEHVAAVQDFERFMSGVSPPPRGDKSLILRADQLRAGY